MRAAAIADLRSTKATGLRAVGFTDAAGLHATGFTNAVGLRPTDTASPRAVDAASPHTRQQRRPAGSRRR